MAGMRSRRLSCISPRWNFFHTRSKMRRGSVIASSLAGSHDFGEAPLGAMEDDGADEQATDGPRGGVREIPRPPEEEAGDGVHRIEQVVMAHDAEAQSL